MIPMKRVGLLAGAATLTLTGGSFADTDLEAQNEELRGRISELESRLVAVESQSSDSWLTEQRADEVRALVQDVLADADTRSSLLSQGMTAGYDEGAVIASADNNWLLRTNLLMQQRYVMNFQDSSAFDDERYGFETTRAKFIMSGHVVSPQWFYLVDVNLGNATVLGGSAFFEGAVPADDISAEFDTNRNDVGNAYLGYDYENGFSIRMGTMKQPVLREELVDAQYQLAVERSFLNYLYSPSYSTGIMLDYEGDQFGVSAMYSNGITRDVSASSAGFIASMGEPGQAIEQDTDFAFAVRGEWLAMGTWEQFADMTSPPGEESGLLIGAAIYYEQSEDDGGAPDIEITELTGDVSWEFGGGNIFGALIYNSMDFEGFDVDQLALVLQGGYYLNDTWELFGRYEWSDLDNPGLDDINILTFGFNKYFAGHNAKWTTDIGVAFDPVLISDVSGADSIELTFPITGYRGDAVDQDGQVVIRTQLQIMF